LSNCSEAKGKTPLLFSTISWNAGQITEHHKDFLRVKKSQQNYSKK
jgi:hypothetical protein